MPLVASTSTCLVAGEQPVDLSVGEQAPPVCSVRRDM
jgi:hypothetical protein